MPETCVFSISKQETYPKQILLYLKQVPIKQKAIGMLHKKQKIFDLSFEKGSMMSL